MKLAQYLDTNKITQPDFAKMVGVTQVAISRYAAGQRMPRREQLEAIFKATNGAVSANDFMPTASEQAPTTAQRGAGA